MHLRTYLIILLTLASQPSFSQDQSLAHEIQQLKTQVELLTQRIVALETERTAPASAPAIEKPSTPWQQLKVGMPAWKVEQYLGKPLSKKKGSVEYWYYSDDKENGPKIKLVLGTVHSWKAPKD